MGVRYIPNGAVSNLFERSSLHGFNRLTKSSHRSAWILVIVLATTIFAAMCWMLMSTFRNNSTSTIIEINYPVSSVAFPKFEICNKNFVYRPNTRNLEDIVVKRGLADSKDTFFRALRDYLTGVNLKEDEIAKLLIALGFLGYTHRRLIVEVGISCEALLHNCLWKKNEIDCQKMFQRVVSVDSICCRFDMEYFKNNTQHLNITYAPSYKSDFGLRVNINFTIEPNIEDEAKVYFFYNERTYYDTPYEFNLASSMTVAVMPEVISSSAYVRDMSPRGRNCGLIDKNSPSAVDIITKYTYEECLTHYHHKYILDECGCIPFYVKDTDPRGGWDDVNLCSVLKFDCVKAMKGNISVTAIFSEFCLHACDEVTYKYDIFIQNKAKWGVAENTLTVYHSTNYCYRFTKVVLLTWDQIFATQGGFFGICLGGSIISIVEFFYAVATTLVTKAVASTKKIFLRKIEPAVKHKLKLLKKYKSRCRDSTKKQEMRFRPKILKVEQHKQRH